MYANIQREELPLTKSNNQRHLSTNTQTVSLNYTKYILHFQIKYAEHSKGRITTRIIKRSAPPIDENPNYFFFQTKHQIKKPAKLPGHTPLVFN